jgi:hypothetical protein
MLASPNRSSEDVKVHAVVVPEFEFIDVQRQELRADVVEGAVCDQSCSVK